MRNLLILLKARFLNAYNINKLFRMGPKKLILFGLLAIYIIVSLAATFFGFAYTLTDSLEKVGLMPFMITMFFAMASFSIFMFSIFSAKGSMFNSDDNDLLLSMPIKPSVILASRLIYTYLWNLVTSLIFILPAVIVYAMRVDVSFMYYLSATIAVILLPTVPTILASIIGYVIAYFTSKSNAKNWMEMILSLIFIFSIYYCMFKANDIITYISSHFDNVEEIMKWALYPLYLINEIFMDNNYVSLILYVIVNIILFIIFVYFLSLNFKKIIAKLSENRAKSNYKMKKLYSSSISKTLYNKEIKRYLSSPIYVFNTSFGVIMFIIAAIASIFFDKDQILKILEVNGDMGMFPLLAAGVAFIVFMSNTTAASISLEGRNFWVIKSLPVNPMQVIKSKILVNLTITIPFGIISLVIMHFAGVIKLFELMMLIIVLIISALTSALFGIIVNLKFPKMDAINDVVVVKQSMSVMVTILVPMAIIFGISGLYAAIGDSIGTNEFIIMAVIVLAILMLIERRVLQTWGIKRFKEIN
jgi:ABC-2 type transport system permease protein